MGNIFSTIGHDIKVGVEDIGKVIIWIPEHMAQTIKVLDTVVKDSPAVKAEIKNLISKVVELDKLVAKDVAEKGLNLPDDMLTLSSIKSLLGFLKGEFFTTMAAAYKDIATDVKPTA